MLPSLLLSRTRYPVLENQLKDKQLEALKCLYAGVYVGTVPTGYGKSICFPDSPFLD